MGVIDGSRPSEKGCIVMYEPALGGLRAAFSTLAVILVVLPIGRRGGERDLEILPRHTIEILSLQEDEVPSGYRLLAHSGILQELGMRSNPDYIDSVAEMEAVARRGGMVSFAALYGLTDRPRVMINGIYFRDPALCDRFLEFQEQKSRRIQAARKTVRNGVWLIMVAIDREADYSERELAEIEDALRRHAKRLKLEQCFTTI